MDAAVRQLVWHRAGDRCEYCRLPQAAAPAFTFHVEHIRARQHGERPVEELRDYLRITLADLWFGLKPPNGIDDGKDHPCTHPMWVRHDHLPCG